MASLVEGFKSLKVDKLLITHQQFNLSTFKQKQAKLAFTMAEILLSLTIIGVVAAITLPSLTGNINERTWNTQRKALYARFSQALPLMGALNNYGVFRAESAEGAGDAVDNCAETFVTAGLSKVLKINNICSGNFADCGVPDKITPLGGGAAIDTPTTLEALNVKMVGTLTAAMNSCRIPKTKAVAFETQNGESIVAYYNPTCIGSMNESPVGSGGIVIQQRICANFIFDLNGRKGPNTVGKDIGFMTVMYPFDAHLYAPYPAARPLPEKHAYNSEVPPPKACTDFDPEYRLPKVDELASMFVNNKLIGASAYATDSFGYISSDIFVRNSGAKAPASQHLISGMRDDKEKTWEGSVWCVKR